MRTRRKSRAGHIYRYYPRNDYDRMVNDHDDATLTIDKIEAKITSGAK